MALSAHPNTVRDDLPPQNARYTQVEIQRTTVPVPVTVLSLLSQPKFAKVLPNTRSSVVEVLKSTKPGMSPPPILEVLPDVERQTGVASIHETVGEMIRMISVDESTAPLGVSPAPVPRHCTANRDPICRFSHPISSQ